MKPMTTLDLQEIETRARQMRAEALRDTFRALRDGVRALRTWVAHRLATARSSKSSARHG